MKTKEELLEKADKLIDEGKFQEVIDLLTDKVLERSNDDRMYNARGRAFDRVDQPEKALEDYLKAIELRPKEGVYYYNCGRAWYIKKEYDKSIRDCDRAIALKPDYPNTYIVKGLALHQQREYDQAIENYNKAIDLNPEYAGAYNNRGNVWHDKKEYYKAIEDFNTCNELDPNDAAYYRNRGDSWNAVGSYTNAINDWRKAVDLDKTFDFLSSDIDLAKAKLGEAVTIIGKTDEKSLYFLESQIEKLSESDKIPVRKMGVVLVDIADKIRKYAADTKNSEGVAHYTKLKVADLLVMKQKDETKTADENKVGLRYYNVVSMNDPEEGKTLLQYLTEEKDDSSLAKSFKAGQLTDENNIYLGSFLPAKDDIRLSHEDDLVMWRTYGKDEHRNEAAGCSLVITLDFFSKNSKYIMLDFEIDGIRGKAIVEKEIDTGQSLYQVLYYDKRKDTIIGDNDAGDVKAYLKQFKEQLEQLVAYKNDTNKEIHEVINSLVYRFISEVRYFFKSADYSFENELRVIQYVSPSDERVKIDDNGTLPRGLYIESDKDIKPYLRKVILGPKVPNPERWMYLEVQMRKHGCNNFKVKPSICKYQ